MTSIPRFVYSGEGKFNWDEKKIRVRPEVANLEDIFAGLKLSNSVYPLVFESSATNVPSVYYRTLEYFRSLKEAPEIISALQASDRMVVMVGVRDLFIASGHGMLSEGEIQLLGQVVNTLKASDVPCIEINGLLASPCPTRDQKLPRFIEIGQAGEIPLDQRQLFISNQLGQLLVFVNPHDLSFHNMENILPLDKYFASCASALSLKVTNFHRVRQDKGVYQFTLSGTGASSLLALDSVDLYTTPLNSATRGGLRALFNSHILSDKLTQALKQKSSGVATELKTGLDHVNTVFRLNRFPPGDRPFRSHLDTPYIDKQQGLASRYTLLIYLTGGHASPALRIGDISITDIAPMTGFIFDQSLEHEGHAYVDNDKVFLRSELIYQADLSTFDESIAKAFSSACYLTRQSMFYPELSKDADVLFNRAVQQRFRLSQGVAGTSAVAPAQLLKQMHGVSFITDGYDYWFPPTVALQSAALLTIADYFGGRIETSKQEMSLGRGKRQKKGDKSSDVTSASDSSDVTIISPPLTSDEEIFGRLHTSADVGELGRWEQSVSMTVLLPEAAQREATAKAQVACQKYQIVPGKHYHWMDYEEDEDEEEEEGAESLMCCPFHRAAYFNPGRCADTRNVFRGVCDIVRDHNAQQLNGSVSIFNGKLYVNQEDMEIGERQITFPRTGALKGINFASCWNGINPENFTMTKSVDVHMFHLPPITYTSSAAGHHLCIDMFHNGYILDTSAQFFGSTLILNPEVYSLCEGMDEDDEVDYWALPCEEHDKAQCAECWKDTLLEKLKSESVYASSEVEETELERLRAGEDGAAVIENEIVKAIKRKTRGLPTATASTASVFPAESLLL